MTDRSDVVGNLAESPEHDLEMDSDIDDLESEDPLSYSSETLVNAAEQVGNLKVSKYINGRRYHNGVGHGSYFLPNDEKEQDRLDLVHYIFQVFLHGKLHLAPLREENVKMVLDVGTGTGIWAIDFAGEYPAAQVIGTDISEIQPAWVPPQLSFEIIDMEEPWEKYYKPNTFDYIHIRAMSGSFRDWDQLLLQAMKHATPGGYVEVQDWGNECFHTSGKIEDGFKLAEFQVLCNSAGEIAGRPMLAIRSMKERMIRLGFEDIQEFVFILPFGPWPKDKHMKELGRIGLVAVAEALEPYGLELLTRYHKMELPRIRELCEDALQQVKRSKGYYTDAFVVYGRKPLDWKEELSTTM